MIISKIYTFDGKYKIDQSIYKLSIFIKHTEHIYLFYLNFLLNKIVELRLIDLKSTFFKNPLTQSIIDDFYFIFFLIITRNNLVQWKQFFFI